eukprot:TRINITY_DN31579_c0_g1_i4.p1 TRINITY_DN31579_c0_g1~~TRINITY_DN31579_c0_g1_i4.p1  ORF type:complete len:631 (-),score=42.04 TRINITY_DN31579_c0_g1_i4:273-2165(-)
MRRRSSNGVVGNENDSMTRTNDKDSDKGKKLEHEGEQELLVQRFTFTYTMPKWFRIVKIWFTGTEMFMAWGWFLGCLTLSLLTTVLLVRISYAQKHFSTALAEKDVDSFYSAVWQFVGIIVIAIPLFAFSGYVEGQFVLRWREALTKHLLSMYFHQQAFYRLQLFDKELDNPDQRICDDAHAFVGTSTVIILAVVKKIFNSVAFAGVLWSISPRLVFLLFVYSFVGTWITTRAFGVQLMRLQFLVLKKEADMRFAMVRIREHAEALAFYDGEQQEEYEIRGRFRNLVNVVDRRIRWLMGLDLWNNAYSYATILVPSLVTAPRYFAGQLEFGDISQAGFAFGRIESALSMIVDRISELSGLAAQTDRLYNLMQSMTQDQFTIQGTHDKSSISLFLLLVGSSSQQSQDRSQLMLLNVEGLTLHTPVSNIPLCNNLSFQLCQGESMLVVGASGCGKTSLLRAIAGLWIQGTGIITCPPKQQLLFLPQKPFFTLGSLREQLLFPRGQQLQITDDQLIQVLEDAKLADLCDRVGGLDGVVQWNHVLSQGEQQRIAFARLFVQQPTLAFLDEASSALDVPTERELYKQLHKYSGAFVSIAHRPQLVQYHNYVLRCESSGEWRFMQSRQFENLDLAN